MADAGVCDDEVGGYGVSEGRPEPVGRPGVSVAEVGEDAMSVAAIPADVHVPVSGTRERGERDAREDGRLSLLRKVRDWDGSRLGYRVVKRAFDIAFSACVIAVALVPSALLCLAILLETPGCPIYGQKRVGRIGPDGKPREFTMWKFRSMVKDADGMLEQLMDKNEVEGPMFKMADDPRVTRIGRFIRKHSLAPVIIGTPGDGEPTKSLLRSANSSLDLQLCERRPGLCSANSSHYKPFKFLSLAFSEGVSVLRKDFAEWPYLHLSPFRFDRNIAGGGL